MRATRMDVARLANVSSATVSYVFNGGRYVSEKLRERVMCAAQELNYMPDLVARSMGAKHTNTMAMLLSDIANPFQMEIMKGVQEAAFKHNYFVNICGGEEHLSRYIDNFIARRVDGVFISVAPHNLQDEDISRLLRMNIKVTVNVERAKSMEGLSGIESDFADGMMQIMKHLTELRHRRIAYISAFDDDFAYDKRLRFFRDAAAAYSVPAVISCGHKPYSSAPQEGYRLTGLCLDEHPEVTAMVCTNDEMAFGAIHALSDRGLRVPQDVSVVGIDNIAMSKICTPPLTTLGCDSAYLGERIFEILYDDIMNERTKIEYVSPKLFVRGSTAPARRT